MAEPVASASEISGGETPTHNPVEGSPVYNVSKLFPGQV